MNLTHRFVRILLLAALAASLSRAAWADAEDAAKSQEAEQSITAAREAFDDGSFPWYDSQTDSLQPLYFRDAPQRQRSSFGFGRVLKIAAWTLLAVLLAAIVVLLVRFARKGTARAAAKTADREDPLLAADQIEALPFLAERRRDDLLGQARFHYQQGNYSEAIIYLFSYQLVQLDKYSVIRLSQGKTNRQYLRETARAAALTSALERTMLAFEGVFFGRRTLDRAGFEACWAGLPEFEQQLRAAT